jgi:hypothetical protein
MVASVALKRLYLQSWVVGSGEEGLAMIGSSAFQRTTAQMAWPPGASSVTSTSTRYYLSESYPAGRKVFFDFAMLPERANGIDSTDSTDCAVRFNGYANFVASTGGHQSPTGRTGERIGVRNGLSVVQME